MRVPSFDRDLTEDVVSNNEVVCPITGEIVSLNDVDAMAETFARIDAMDKEIYAVKVRIRRRFGELAMGDKKTQRVQGKRKLVKVTMPDKLWDQGVLKELYNSFPDVRDDYLKIESIRVRLMEFKKLVNTSVVDNPPLDYFRKTLLAAERPANSPPSIIVEK